MAYSSVDAEEHRLCKAHYYGGQRAVPPKLRAWRRSRGISGREVDLFPMQINAVLGQEAQRQVDWIAIADDESGEEVAEATNEIVNEIARLHDVNHHCSEAYKWQVINGLGWSYFGRNPNPLGLPYDCHTVPSTEILWDRRCRRLDLEDCEWLARRRYLSKDQAQGLWPEHKRLIEETFSSRGSWGPIVGAAMGRTMLEGAVFVGDSGVADHLYRQGIATAEDEIAVFDMYYRVTEMRTFLVPPGEALPVEYDEHDSRHVQALFSGQSVPFRGPKRVMRNAWFIGPYLVSDEPSPHPHDMFPYVCYRGYQEEDTGAVYGIGRSMIAPVNAYNDAKTQIYALMDKITVLVGTNTLATSGMTLEQIVHEVQKEDGVLEVPEGSKVEIIHHYEHIQRLDALMERSFEELRLVSGVTKTMTGQEQSQKSGVAMQVSVEQTTQSLADMDENYQMARRMKGRLMLAHARHEIGKKERAVSIKEDGQVVKTVVLNQKNEHGELVNDFRGTRMQIAMADVQTSAGFRAQQHAMFREAAPGAAEPMQPILFEAMIRTSNLPAKERDRMLAQIKKVYGTSADPEEQAEIDAQRAEQAQREAELVERERMAKVMLDEARAQHEIAQAKAEMAQGAQAAAEAAGQATSGADEEAEKLELVNEMRRLSAQRADFGERVRAA